MTKPTIVADCRQLELRRVVSAGGSITPVEGGADVPFPIERVYYLYDVPGGAARGGHAHRALQQLVVAVMGSFDLVLDDGHTRRSVRLDRAYHGLYMPPMIWRELVNFSSGAVCMVLASLPYDERDYLRDYEEFVQLKQSTYAGAAVSGAVANTASRPSSQFGSATPNDRRILPLSSTE